MKEDTGTKSFTIKKGGWQEVSATQATDEDILELLQGNYTIENKNVYSISANAGEYFSVYPLLSESEWAGKANFINREDHDVNVNTESSKDGEGMYLGITIPDPFTEELIIVFRGTDYINKKALVITPAI